MTKHSEPRVIYVMGIDGSGKTTVSEHLMHEFEKRGYKVESLWLRFNHVLSKPLLGFCRLIGLTRYEVIEGIRVGYHDFYRSKMISWMFIFVQYIDAFRVKYMKIKPKLLDSKSTLILDRYVYDILVDIIVDTRMPEILTNWVGVAFINLLPKDTLLILVDRSLDDVLAVRPEGIVDTNFEARFSLYQKIKTNPNINVISNTGSLADLLSKAESCAGL